MPNKKILLFSLASLLLLVFPTGGVFGEAGDQPDATPLCETTPCANPAGYCVGTKVPGGDTCVFTGSCYGCNTLNCGTGTKLPDCSGAYNYCVGTNYNVTCGTCAGTKQKDCSDSGSHCLLSIYTSSNGCGMCVGTKAPDCSDKSSHCAGEVYNSPNGCGICVGTKSCNTCTASCGNWSACVNNTQTRTCTRTDCSTYTDSQNCGTSCNSDSSCAANTCIGSSCWDNCEYIAGKKDCSTTASCGQSCSASAPCVSGLTCSGGVCGTYCNSVFTTSNNCSCSSPSVLCGNGRVDAGEDCDYNAHLRRSCASGQYCSSTCKCLSYSCTGLKPAGAVVCDNDESNLTSDVLWKNVASSSGCTSGRKCEYYLPQNCTHSHTCSDPCVSGACGQQTGVCVEGCPGDCSGYSCSPVNCGSCSSGDWYEVKPN